MGGVAGWLRRVVARYRGELVGLARHCFLCTIAPHLQLVVLSCARRVVGHPWPTISLVEVNQAIISLVV